MDWMITRERARSAGSCCSRASSFTNRALLTPGIVVALLSGLTLMTVGAQLGPIVAGTLLALFLPTALLVWRFH